MIKIKSLLILVISFASASAFSSIDGNAEVNCNLHNPTVAEARSVESQVNFIVGDYESVEAVDAQSKAISEDDAG